MLARTGRDPGPVPSHEGPVLSHPIPQRSDPIPVPVPCQAWTGSSHPGLVPSHPGPTPGRDGTRMGYPGPDGQSKEHYKHLELIIEYLQQVKLYMNFKKYDFFKTEVKYLDFLVNKNSLCMNLLYIKTISD